MKKLPTIWIPCSECHKEIERDARFEVQRVICFDCRRKKNDEYARKRYQHISKLLKKHPFRFKPPSNPEPVWDEAEKRWIH